MVRERTVRLGLRGFVTSVVSKRGDEPRAPERVSSRGVLRAETNVENER